MSDFGVEKFSVDGLEIAQCIQDEAQGIRARVFLPYATDAFIDDSLPTELPHVLEHVICSGDGKIPPSVYRNRTSEYGGFSNAQTWYTNNGLLGFETEQPDTALHIAKGMFRAIVRPHFTHALFESERAIVRNELHGNLHDLARQRDDTRRYSQGILYNTTERGLSRLDECTVETGQAFHQQLLTKDNIRVVVAGSSEGVKHLTEEAVNAFGGLARGPRLYSRNQQASPHPDYYAAAADLPQGQSLYGFSVAGEATPIAKPALQGLVRTCLQGALNDGEMGVTDQSRQQGLSYGLSASVWYFQNQWNVAIGDKTNSENIQRQIKLLQNSISTLHNYSIHQFDAQRRKIDGSTRLYPQNFLQSVRGYESAVGPGVEYEYYTPAQYQEVLQTANPMDVVTAIREIAQSLSSPQFTNRYAYGDNPF